MLRCEQWRIRIKAHHSLPVIELDDAVFEKVIANYAGNRNADALCDLGKVCRHRLEVLSREIRNLNRPQLSEEKSVFLLPCSHDLSTAYRSKFEIQLFGYVQINGTQFCSCVQKHVVRTFTIYFHLHNDAAAFERERHFDFRFRLRVSELSKNNHKETSDKESEGFSFHVFLQSK